MNVNNNEYANLGDIITIGGYGEMLFRVFAKSYNEETNAYESYVDVFYDVISLETGEFLLADNEDITIIDSPSTVDTDTLKMHADDNSEAIKSIIETLGKYDHEIMYSSSDENDDNIGTEIDMSGHKIVDDDNSAIDKLLDEMNDWKELVKNFGEDVHYMTNIKRIKDELKRITGGRD